MTNQLYSIEFRKEIESGQELEVVKGNLAKLFKTELKTIEKMFLRDSVVIKKDLTKAHAEKYREVVKKAGAVVYLLEQSVGKNKTNPSESIGPKAIEATTSSSWTTIVEFEEFMPAHFDIQAYGLAPEGERLIEDKVVESPKYEFKDMNLAPEGQLLVEESEFQPAQFNTQGLKLKNK